MSAIRWASTVQCDFPVCKETSTVQLQPTWPARVLHDGWTDLREMRILLEIPRGQQIGEICPLHSQLSLGEFVKAFAQEDEDA